MAKLLDGPDLTYVSFPISKVDKNADGDLVVWGRATDGGIDADDQIVDPEWSGKALSDWLRTGGNVRVMHSAQHLPAGKGLEVDSSQGDGHWVRSLIVEPTAKKLVEKGVLQAYSIGIAQPKIVRDTVAKGGRIVSGIVHELSLVDRPANARCGITLVKSASAGAAQGVEELFGDVLDILAKVEAAEVAKGKTKPAPEAVDDEEPEGAADDAADEAKEQADAADGGVDDATEDEPKQDVAVPDVTKSGTNTYDGARAEWLSREPTLSGAPTSGTAFLAKRAEWERWHDEGDAEGLDGTEAGRARWVEKRDFDPGVGGGVDRDKLPEEDFADPENRKFPIHSPKDVADAAGLAGHAADSDAVRERITSIAHRKGPEFVAQLPESWTADKSITTTAPNAEGLAPFNLQGQQPYAGKGVKSCRKCGVEHHADSKLRRCEGCGAKLPKANKGAGAADVVKAGPKGYVHGWIHVGGPGTEEMHRRLGDAHHAMAEGRHADAVNHLTAAAGHAPDAKTRREIEGARNALGAKLMGKPDVKPAAKPKAERGPGHDVFEGRSRASWQAEARRNAVKPRRGAPAHEIAGAIGEHHARRANEQHVAINPYAVDPNGNPMREQREAFVERSVQRFRDEHDRKVRALTQASHEAAPVPVSPRRQARIDDVAVRQRDLEDRVLANAVTLHPDDHSIEARQVQETAQSIRDARDAQALRDTDPGMDPRQREIEERLRRMSGQIRAATGDIGRQRRKARTSRKSMEDDVEYSGPNLVKVGPKGYEHGWIFVGAPGVGAAVHHSTHGRGIVTRTGKKTSGVQFDSGHHAAFEHGGKPGKDGSHFVERATRSKPKAPKPTVAAKPTAAEPKSDLRDTARAHGISGGHYDRNFHSTLDNIQRQHGGKQRETAAALRQAARRERAHRRSLPIEGYELNHSNSKTSERGYRQLADVVEGKANKSIDIDKYTVKRMHDATCAAYPWAAVTAEYPALKSAADAVVPAWFTAQAVDAATKGDTARLVDLGNLASDADALTKGAVEPAMLDDARAWLHKTFADMYPDTHLTPADPPTPGQFQRPYIRAGHAPLNVSAGQPTNVPPAMHVPDPDDFHRPYLTAGHESASPSSKGDNLDTGGTLASGSARHYYRNASREAARGAMQAMHDHIAGVFPDMCPMAASKSVMPPDMGDTNRPRPVRPAPAPRSPGEKSADSTVTKTMSVDESRSEPTLSKKQLAKLVKSAVKQANDRLRADLEATHQTQISALKAEIDDLGAQPDPAQAPLRGVVRKATASDPAPAEKVSLVEQAQHQAATERAEEIAFLRKFVDHPNLGIREAAEARLGLLTTT